MCVCVLIDSKVYQLFIIVWSFAVSLFASLLVLFSFFVFIGVFVCEFDTAEICRLVVACTYTAAPFSLVQADSSPISEKV